MLLFSAIAAISSPSARARPRRRMASGPFASGSDHGLLQCSSLRRGRELRTYSPRCGREKRADYNFPPAYPLHPSIAVPKISALKRWMNLNWNYTLQNSHNNCKLIVRGRFATSIACCWAAIACCCKAHCDMAAAALCRCSISD
jgi:hypothetical protein